MSSIERRCELYKLTWKEAAQWVKRDPVLMMPIGSIECEGPHLPLGSDFLVSLSISRKVAERTGSLVIPGVPYGLSPGFVGFPGTICLQPDTLATIMREIGNCLMGQGFQRLLVVANHGPNMPAVETAARQLMDRFPHSIVAAVWPAELTGKVATEIGIPEASRGHGGDPATSIMLNLYPEDLRMDLGQADYPPEIGSLRLKSSSAAEINGVPVKWFSKVHTWSGSGVTGNPLSATAENGQIIFERVCKMVEDVVLYMKSMELDNEPPSPNQA